MTTFPSRTQKSNTLPEAVDTIKPRYTVTGNKDSYLIRVELPGVKKDGLEIRLDQSVLLLTAKRTLAPLSTWKTVHRELNDLNYALRLKLNVPVDDNKMSAKLEDGVLNLTLPVKEAVKPRRITVQ